METLHFTLTLRGLYMGSVRLKVIGNRLVRGHLANLQLVKTIASYNHGQIFNISLPRSTKMRDMSPMKFPDPKSTSNWYFCSHHRYSSKYPSIQSHNYQKFKTYVIIVHTHRAQSKLISDMGQMGMCQNGLTYLDTNNEICHFELSVDKVNEINTFIN